tara:strand:- start:1807 stop:3090 length:1284 start_codon:yes stop_codon:yes gene_type:complete
MADPVVTPGKDAEEDVEMSEAKVQIKTNKHLYVKDNMNTEDSGADAKSPIAPAKEGGDNPNKEIKEAEEKAKQVGDKIEKGVPSAKPAGSESESDDDLQHTSKRFKVEIIPRSSRSRKEVKKFVVESPGASTRAIEIQTGKGEQLKDIPIIEHHLKSKRRDDDAIKLLHMVMYGRRGKVLEMKNRVLEFSGFVYEDKKKDRAKLEDKLNKPKMSELKEICRVLDLHVAGTKAEIIERILDFLEKPVDSGKRVPVAKSKKRSRSTSSKSPGKKGQKAKKKKTKSEPEDEEDVDRDVDDEDEDEDEEEGEEDDEEYDAQPPKKKKKLTKKSEKASTPKKAAAKKKKAAAPSDDSDDDMSLGKVAEKPIIEKAIRSILTKHKEEGDLLKCTVGSVRSQVNDILPIQADQKELKSMIKEIFLEFIGGEDGN